MSDDTEPSVAQSEAQRITKGIPSTPAERYLHQLCEKSFLSLWSYPAVFRDQGRSAEGDGKEVADYLVVFENDIIIFSDKAIEFAAGAPLDVAWRRWHRRAILGAARQLWGAERWIRQFPDRLFLDRQCVQSFPYALPAPAAAHFHLIVVAHGAAKVCSKLMGGSGSLMFVPLLASSGEMPFAVGDLDKAQSFVHVLDDTSLDIVMKHCDTVSDFIWYLRKKEAFARSGRLVSAAGEEELLAMYLKEMNSAGEHDFILPADGSAVVIIEGEYEEFRKNDQLKRKLVADEPSYVWDQLIESFAHNVLGGTLYEPSTPKISEHEIGLRWLAREPRVRRRMLAKALVGMILDPDGLKTRRARVVQSTQAGDPFYVFLALDTPTGMDYATYRQVRRSLLTEYCRAVRMDNANAHTVVGIATDFAGTPHSSEDFCIYEAPSFSEEQRREIAKVREKWNILQRTNRFHRLEKEYPLAQKTTEPPRGIRVHGDVGRNDPCPCGSGKKYKKCCGK